MTIAEDVALPPDILSAEYLADPYPLQRVLRDHYPVLYHEPTQSYLLSRFEDVAGAFRSPQFSSRNYEWQLEPLHGRTILQMEGTRALEAPRAAQPVLPRQGPGEVHADDPGERHEPDPGRGRHGRRRADGPGGAHRPRSTSSRTSPPSSRST